MFNYSHNYDNINNYKFSTRAQRFPSIDWSQMWTISYGSGHQIKNGFFGDEWVIGTDKARRW